MSPLYVFGMAHQTASDGKHKNMPKIAVLISFTNDLVSI